MIIIPPPEKRSMAGMMNFLQVLKCLQEGKIVGAPKLNENGDWELTLERLYANRLVTVKAVAMCTGAKVTKIVVFA